MKDLPLRYPRLDPNGRSGGYEFVVPVDADQAWFDRAADIADGWAEGRGLKNIGYTVHRLGRSHYLIFLVERIPFGIRARRRWQMRPARP